MKKQILYPKFIPRLFATTIDLVILSIALTPIMNFISRYVFIYLFYQFFEQQSINMKDYGALAESLKSPEFISYASSSGEKFLSYMAILFIINAALMGAYFVLFWYKFGATPGKMVMRMKIVDADDYSSKISISRLCKRFCGYLTSFVGIFGMIMRKNGQATHDKFANTVVVKN